MKGMNMKSRNAMLVALSLAVVTGCMHNSKQANDQPAGGGEVGSTVAQATAPLEAEQPLNHVERADKLIGEEVLTSNHLKTGKIDDFVVDQDSGQILYAIVGIGGVLGVGETRVAVPPNAFIEAKKGMVQINVDKRKLTSAPQVPSDMDKADANFLSNVYGYYGLPAQWNRTSSSAQAAFHSARKVSELTGMKVVNSAHQDIGKVEAVVLDVPDGRELYLVLSPGTDMNLGNDYYAIPPKALKFSPDDKVLVGADVSREKLSNAPHFAKDDWSEMSNTAWAQKVYQYYGQTLQSVGIEPTGRTGDNTNVYHHQK